MNKNIATDAVNTSEGLAFHLKPRLSVLQSLAVRALVVLALIGVAVVGHWLDRGGLRDNVDGEISLLDVVYFTAITITTVGYGDIVPVTDQARMFDTFVVTPIRVFIWLIFLGTAYTFVLQHQWAQFRTSMTRRSLVGHTIICGFGTSGEVAAKELLLIGQDPESILVIDPSPQRIEEAVALGLIGIVGDARSNAALKAAKISTATALLVTTSLDDATALVVLSARQLNAAVKISVSVRAQENESIMYQAGANVVINPVNLGGHLLARSSAHQHAVDYLRDLASSDGHAVLREREALPDEIGKSPSEIQTGLVVRLIRKGMPVAAVNGVVPVVVAGDVLIEIITLNP